MSANFSAPDLRPPRVSILSSAEVITPSNDRWFGGWTFLPLSADDSSGTYVICDPESPFDPGLRLGAEDFFPWLIYATDECSTFGSESTDFVKRARQKLAVVEPWYIERAIWENPDSLGNPSFVGSPSTILTENEDPLGGFAALDAAVAQDLHDGRGMIHMTPQLFDLLQQYRIFRREGNVWFSPLDNIVVPGRGYTGNGPNEDGGANENEATDTVTWMFGHPGIIRVYRSDVYDLPSAEVLEKQMARPINDIRAQANRVVGYDFANTVSDDDDTGTYSVSVDMSIVPGNSGSSSSSPLVVSTPVAEDDESYASATVYLGYSLVNADDETLATIIIYNGSDNTGPILDVVNLAGNESAREWYDPGIVTSGIFVEVTAGAITANSTIRYKTT